MDLVQLRTFLAVVEHRGFRRAARRLYLSEPAVSRQVAELERSVGVPLLLRGPFGAEATTAGLVLAERAQVLLDDRDATIRAARSAGLSGDLVLSLMPGGAAELTGPLLRHLARALPQVRFRTRDLTLPEWPSSPSPGVDLTIMRDPVADDRFRVTTVVTERMRLAVPPTMSVADATELTVDEVLELPFARLSSQVEPRFTAFWTLREQRRGIDVHFRGAPRDSPESAALGVARGDGVAFATPMIVRQFAAPGAPRLVRVPEAPDVRLALVSALDDRRPLIDAVHRETEWVTRRLGPLVLPELAEPLSV